MTLPSMTLVQAGLAAQVLAAAAGSVAAFTLPDRGRRLAAGGAGIVLGLAGALTGAAAWSAAGTGTGTGTGSGSGLTLTTPLPGGLLSYAPDRLGGAFLVLVGLVAALAALWAIGGAHGPAASRTGWTAYLLFVLGLQAVFSAADVVAFLLAWEVMAVASTVLVLADHARGPAVTTAGLWYATMTQLSFLLALSGFAVLAGAAGGTGFAAIARLDPTSRTAGVGAVLLVLGLCTKAGAVPLHVWLPKAHPEAPSHVSAVMSAAMVKAGVYGVVLVLTRLLPHGPAWWGLLVLALGAASAVFGILQASVAVDLKRLLAYSTTENVGLMLCAIGVAQVLAARGDPGSARVMLVAALMLAFAHAAAKTGLFLGAGAVLHGTGHRDLDRLGGLWSRMPWTCVTFGIGALGAAALPISAGFVAEWTMLQSLIHARRLNDPVVAITMPVTVTVVALTAGLALLTFAKAFGIAFLGRARSPEALVAQEVSAPERISGALAAVAVLGLGLLPGPLAGAASRAISTGTSAGTDGVTGATAGSDGVTGAGTAFGSGLRLDGLGPVSRTAALLDPVALAGVAVLLTALVLVAVRGARARAPRRDVELGWGCGGARVSPRMQYTATSYAEPLVRIFDSALGVTRSVEARGVGTYLEQEVRFRQRLVDVLEQRGYRPLLAAVEHLGRVARRIQNGSINRYLAFSFAALLAVLAVVSR